MKKISLILAFMVVGCLNEVDTQSVPVEDPDVYPEPAACMRITTNACDDFHTDYNMVCRDVTPPSWYHCQKPDPDGRLYCCTPRLFSSN